MIFNKNLSQLNLTGDLRSYYSDPLKRVSVLGGSALNDNLGGDFFWSSTSVATDDGVNVFQVTGLTTGRWLRITTPKQTLTLGTTAGNIILSDGGNVSLSNLNTAGSSVFTDANVIPANPGFYPYTTTTGATNYPTARGSGWKVVRVGSDARGYFEFYKSDTGDRNMYFRMGVTINTFTEWTIVNGGRGTTANRPATAEQGTPYYDTTLGRPIWWSGSVWKDATGTTV